jgi:Putative restriction endonuclease
MERKRREYFENGTQLVWYFDLKSRTVTVYTSPDQSTVLDESGTLDGDGDGSCPAWPFLLERYLNAQAGVALVPEPSSAAHEQARIAQGGAQQ